MAVEVTLTDTAGGERIVEKHPKATNYRVDTNGHMHVTGWDGMDHTSVAGYVAGAWYKVTVLNED